MSPTASNVIRWSIPELVLSAAYPDWPSSSYNVQVQVASFIVFAESSISVKSNSWPIGFRSKTALSAVTGMGAEVYST